MPQWHHLSLKLVVFGCCYGNYCSFVWYFVCLLSLSMHVCEHAWEKERDRENMRACKRLSTVITGKPDHQSNVRFRDNIASMHAYVCVCVCVCVCVRARMRAHACLSTIITRQIIPWIPPSNLFSWMWSDQHNPAPPPPTKKQQHTLHFWVDHWSPIASAFQQAQQTWNNDFTSSKQNVLRKKQRQKLQF